MAKKSDHPKSPYLASLDEVRITRDGKTAIVEYVEENIVSTHHTIGPKIRDMSDEDILDLHNQSIRVRGEAAAEYRNKPLVEIPLGNSQVEYHRDADQWVPRGDVLRCIVEEDTEEDCRLPAIVIDDQELTWEEFGRLMLIRAGWGMRIAFVEKDELHRMPKIEVREPDEKGAGNG
jgi:hypothetical protein